MSSSKAHRTSDRQRRVLIFGLLIAGILLAGFFGLRALRSYIQIQQTGLQPGVTEAENVRGWMTVPYISKAYGVPEDYLFREIGIPQEGNRERSLADLNREYAQGARAVVVNRVRSAIRRYQAEQTDPPSDAGNN